MSMGMGNDGIEVMLSNHGGGLESKECSPWPMKKKVLKRKEVTRGRRNGVPTVMKMLRLGLE